jgi:glycosyl transferase family 61
MPFEPPRKLGIAERIVTRIAALPPIAERRHLFRNILVHPTQEMRDPDGAFFRGGPDWPRFGMQILVRHCWGAIPRPIDARPLPARSEWPYFDPRYLPIFWPHLGIEPRLSPPELEREASRLAASQAPLPEQTFDTVDAGIWCGPVSLHFGHMIADFGMRIAASSRIEADMPLVFSLPPFRQPDPPAHFWQILGHLGIDPRSVLLLRKPNRFRRLYVLPQAERPFGAGPSWRHLAFMDAIAASDRPPERDLASVFVSRAGLPEGRFAAESYLDEAMAAAGVTVLHPETADLRTQLQLYRRARLLVFSEGSAVHALQLLGIIGCDIVILVRRPGNQIAAGSLRPRARSLRYLPAARTLLHGLTPSGRPDTRAGLSVLDEERCLAGLKALGIDLAPFWEPEAYAERRDVDLERWRAERVTRPSHPRDRELVERQLRELSLTPQRRAQWVLGTRANAGTLHV